MTRIEEQRYEGRALRVASVRRWPLELGVTMSLSIVSIARVREE